MAELILGPVLRYLDETEATVWAETDAPCEVEILGFSSPTFHVAGHHYALVHVRDLEPGQTIPYEVRLDGEVRWPEEHSVFPPSVIRTPARDLPVRIAFGSCRVTIPHERPWTLRKDQDPCGREVDALHALALRMLDQRVEEWPTRLMMLGDQVYADEVSPGARDFIASRRDTGQPPGEEVADFEEYTRLYHDAWSDPMIRWLLSTMASAMIFDDHDVHDDWNISEEWLHEMRARPWWQERIVGAFMSYWIYQHIGNLSPSHLEADDLYRRVREADDGAVVLRPFARRADLETEGTRWSYCRDYGGIRVLVIDSRAGRVLEGGRRSMVDDHEWAWICDHLVGGHDHVVIASSLPLFLGRGMHWLEAWSEAVCAGAWGRLAARLGERMRRALDLEHWAAFGESFERITTRIREVAAGEHGEPPGSIVVLSGDVHHAYLSEVAFRRDAGVRSSVWQVVCSPLRNPLDARERRAIHVGASRVGYGIGRLLARAAGVPDPGLRWRMVDGPFFDNQVATLELHERGAWLTVERTRPADEDTDGPQLHECFSRRLA